MVILWRPFVVGVLCALPFVVLNALIATPVPAFVVWLRPDGHTSVLELVWLWGAIGAVLVGGWVVLRVLWQQRRFVLLNGVLGIGLLIAGVALAFTFGAEMVACDWQQVANCD